MTTMERTAAPKQAAILRELPGYVTDLHHRLAQGSWCVECADVWPCSGARRQSELVRQWAHPSWYDEQLYRAIKASAARYERGLDEASPGSES